jgi:hypothetical protein
VLSDSDNCPSFAAQLSGNPAIAHDVATNLCLPEFVAISGKLMATIATVPETSIDEHEHLRHRKHDVGISQQADSSAVTVTVASKVPHAESPHCSCERSLRLRATAIAPHGFQTLGWSHHVHTTILLAAVTAGEGLAWMSSHDRANMSPLRGWGWELVRCIGCRLLTLLWLAVAVVYGGDWCG